VTWADFEHVNTNFSTVLFKHSVTISYVSATWLRRHPSAALPDGQYTGKVQQYDQNVLWVLLQILLYFSAVNR